MLLPVFVSSWQVECCGEPLKLGEHVQWRLRFVEAGRSDSGPVEHHVELTAHTESFSWDLGEVGRKDTRLTAGAAVLYWSAAGAVAGAVTLTGEYTRTICGCPGGLPRHDRDGPTDPRGPGTTARILRSRAPG
jgi:hypothetical protein